MNEIERQAPELRVQKWIGKDGESIAPFKLSDIGPGPKILLIKGMARAPTASNGRAIALKKDPPTAPAAKPSLPKKPSGSGSLK